MEYLREGNLSDMFQDYIKESRMPTSRDFKVYAAHLVQGLKYLHEQNILHRDLKPDNILVDAKGYLKITDFGLSRVVDSAEKKGLSPGLFSEEGMVGTPDYMAIEFVEEKTPITTAVDWWSLGCILYQMLHGYPPFNDISIERIHENIRRFNIEWNHEDKLKNLQRYYFVMGLLHPDPKRRLGTRGAEEIMNHPFFKDINWENLDKELSPHIKFVRKKQKKSPNVNSVRQKNKQFFALISENSDMLKSSTSSIKKKYQLLSEFVDKELQNMNSDVNVNNPFGLIKVQPFVKNENLKRLNLKSYEQKFRRIQLNGPEMKRVYSIVKDQFFIINYFDNYDFLFNFKLKKYQN
jgi:serine/threonine protein kinase